MPQNCQLEPGESAVIHNDLLGRYLRLAPVAHAVFRSAELGPLAGLPIERPIIDIGCGAGEFAEAAMDGCVDVGLDPSRRRLDLARRTRKYRHLHQASAGEIPYARETFQSALSISVFEHVADPLLVLKEIHRVLRRDGTLIATILLDEITKHLSLANRLLRLRLPILARWYVRGLHRAFVHQSLLPRCEWERLFAEAGFVIEDRRLTVSHGVVECWERHLPTAWPYRVTPCLTRACISREPGRRLRLRDRFSDLVDDTCCNGCCLVVRARKK
ncbi:MAG: class I SAM-dependent methyltransferase [Pirellulaceae bacterium]|nr:class I SAM-dependent methyltransferase [Pirellulaceae bacterium]